MSTFSLGVGSFTTNAGTADAAALTASQFLAIQGGTSTQLSMVDEIYIGGQATATAPAIMVLGRDSTVGVTLCTLASGNSMGLLHPSGGVLTNVPVGFINSTTK